MQRFIVRLKHDKGNANIVTLSETPEDAATRATMHENAPFGACVSVSSPATIGGLRRGDIQTVFVCPERYTGGKFTRKVALSYHGGQYHVIAYTWDEIEYIPTHVCTYPSATHARATFARMCKGLDMCGAIIDMSKTVRVRRLDRNGFWHVSNGAGKRWARLTGQLRDNGTASKELTRVHEQIKRLRDLYNAERERLSLETFGKGWHLSMYKVSGICRDEFSEVGKKRLRALNLERQQFEYITRVYLSQMTGNPKKWWTAYLGETD